MNSSKDTILPQRNKASAQAHAPNPGNDRYQVSGDQSFRPAQNSPANQRETVEKDRKIV